MINSALYLNPEGKLECDLTLEQIEDCFQSRQGLLWVDVQNPAEDDIRLIIEAFKFHPLAVADCISEDISPPKANEFDDYLFIILHGINYHDQTDILETTELDIFLGQHFVLTWHWSPLFTIESVKQQMAQDARPMKRGADFLTHIIMDTLIDHIMPVVDQMIDHAEDIEDETITNPRRSTLDAILKLKRSIRRLNRVVTPQREVVNRLSRGDFALIQEETRIFYRDIYDDIFRIEALTQSLRDRASDTMSVYLSSVANRQNDSMRVLAIVAAIFMPLSLLAGVYGMNFDYMPELGWKWAYFVVVGVIGMIIMGMLWFFWARDWIAVGGHKMSRLSPMQIGPHTLKKRMGNVKSFPGLDPNIVWKRKTTFKESDPEAGTERQDQP